MDPYSTINVRGGNLIYGSTLGDGASVTYNRTTVNSLAPFQQNFPLLLVPPHVPENFVGRVSELKEFRKDLLYAKTLIISGFGGMGKSSIAKKMAHELYYDNLCCGVLWFEVHKSFQLQKELYHLGKLVLPPYETSVNKDDNINYLVNRLRNSLIHALENRCNAPCKRLLVVMDDVWHTTIRQVEDFLAVFPEGTLLLVTTRDSGLEKNFIYKGRSQTLCRMNLEDGQELLQTYLMDVSSILLRELAQVIKGHPLAMAIAAKRVSWRESQEKHLKRHIIEYSSLSTALDSISSDYNLVNPSELDYVLRSSYLDLDLTKQLIYQALGILAEDSYFSVEMVAKMIELEIDQTEECFQYFLCIGLLQKVTKSEFYSEDTLWCQHPLLTADANRLIKNNKEVQKWEVHYRDVVIQFMNLRSRSLDYKHISSVGKQLALQLTVNLPQIQWEDSSSSFSAISQWLKSTQEDSKSIIMESLADFIDAFISLPRYQQYNIGISAQVCLIPELIRTLLVSEAKAQYNLSIQPINTISKHWIQLVNKYSKCKIPSIDFAILDQDIKTVRLLLLVCHINVNVYYDGTTPLHLAVKTRNFDIVNDLIKLGKAKVNCKDFMNYSPLYYAATSTDINIIKLLINNGADVNEKNMNGETAIHILTYLNYFTSTQQLINEYGANVYSTLADGSTLLHLAAFKSNYGEQPKEEDRNKFVKWLVEQYHFDINIYNIRGYTPLYYFLQNGYIDTFQLLLNIFKTQVDFNLINRTTLLYIAVEYSTLDIVQLLINNYGADVYSRTVGGETILHFAAKNDKYGVEIVQWILNKYKININIKDYFGNTPTDNALDKYLLAFEAPSSIFKYLVEDCHAELSLKCFKKNCQYIKHIEVIEYFIEHRDTNKKAIFWDEILRTIDDIEVGKWLIKKYQLNINLYPIAKVIFLYNIAQNTIAKRSTKYIINILNQLVNDFNINLQEIIHNNITLLDLAVEYHNLELIKWLVEKHGFSVQIQTTQRYIPFLLAINSSIYFTTSRYTFDTKRWLVEQLKDNINMKTNNGHTILHLILNPKDISFSGNILPVIQQLVDDGAEITAETNTGETLIHFAAGYGSLKIIKWLVINYSFDTDAKTKHARTPLHYAVKSQINSMLKNYITSKYNKTSLIFNDRIYTKACKIVKWLLDMNYADPYARDDEGCTFFHLAASTGEILTLHWIIFDSHLEMDINICDDAGRTPLHHAAMRDDRIREFISMYLVIHLLVQWGADVNATTITGWTPLHFLSENNDLLAMKILLRDPRVDINAKTNKGWTVLHFAANGTFLDMVIWLLDVHKMDATSKDINGQTPIDIAAEKLENAGKFNQEHYAVWKALSIASKRPADTILVPVGPQVLYTSCKPKQIHEIISDSWFQLNTVFLPRP